MHSEPDTPLLPSTDTTLKLDQDPKYCNDLLPGLISTLATSQPTSNPPQPHFPLNIQGDPLKHKSDYVPFKIKWSLLGAE